MLLVHSMMRLFLFNLKIFHQNFMLKLFTDLFAITKYLCQYIEYYCSLLSIDDVVGVQLDTRYSIKYRNGLGSAYSSTVQRRIESERS